MGKAFNLILVSLSLLITSGCSYQHSLKYQEPQYSSSKFPPIHLIVRPPGEYVTNGQIQYANEFTYELTKRNKFSALTNYTGSPYTVDIVYGGSDSRSHPQMIWWVITAASLFIVPAQFEAEFTMDVNIHKNNQLIKQYSYKDTVSGWSSLFNPPRSAMTDIHKYFIDRFLNDLERDNVFKLTSNNEKLQSI